MVINWLKITISFLSCAGNKGRDDEGEFSGTVEAPATCKNVLVGGNEIFQVNPVEEFLRCWTSKNDAVRHRSIISSMLCLNVFALHLAGYWSYW